MFNSAQYRRPWRLPESIPPQRIQTPRLVLRCWRAADAPLFQSAFDLSREYVSAWIPPALDEPSELDGVALRLANFREEFLAGVGFVYGVFDAGEVQVLGEAGLMPRIGPHALEIGYWIRIDQAGRGLATEATWALTSAGLALPGVDRIEIHCDPANAPSAAVPRKLGYRIVDGLRGHQPDQGVQSNDTLVFELTADEGWAGSSAGEPMDA